MPVFWQMRMLTLIVFAVYCMTDDANKGLTVHWCLRVENIYLSKEYNHDVKFFPAVLRLKSSTVKLTNRIIESENHLVCCKSTDPLTLLTLWEQWSLVLSS